MPAGQICLTDFKNAVKEYFSHDEMDSILEKINKNAEKYMRERNTPKAQALGQSVDEFIEEHKQRAKIKRLQYKMTALKMAKASEQIDSFKSKMTGLESFFTGTERVGKGSRSSVAGNCKVTVYDVIGNLRDILDKYGVTDAFNDKDLDEQNAMAKAGDEVENEQCMKVGKAVNEAYKYILNKFKLESIYIKDAEGYIAKTIHNVDRMLSPTGTLRGDIALRAKLFLKYKGVIPEIDKEIQETAFNRWLNVIKPLTDNEKTFDKIPLKDRDKFFRGIYEHLTTGIRKDLPSGDVKEVNTLVTMRKSYNIADKLTSGKVWHPKGSRGWIEYNKVYGYGSFHDAVLAQMEQLGDAIGIVQKLGPNPKNLADRIINKYEKIITRSGKNREYGVKARLTGVKRFVNYKLSPVSRTSNSIGAKIIEGIKMTRYFQLGGLLIRSIPDANTMALRMSKYKGNYFSNMGNITKEFINGLPKGEQAKVALSLRLYADGAMGAQLSRFGNTDLGYGIVSKMLMIQDRLSLMNRWDNSGRWAIGKVLSNDLANYVGDSFDKIPEDKKTELLKYGIDSKVWKLVGRIKGNLIKADGDYYLTPDAALNMTKEDVAKYWYRTNGEISDLKYETVKSDIHNRMLNFFHDQVSYGKIFPNDSDYAFIKVNMPNHPFFGGLINLLTMFKSFDLAMMRRTWGRFLYSDSENGLNVWQNLYKNRYDVGKFLVGAMAMGNIAYVAEEMLRGRFPKYDNPMTYFNIAMSGSAGGLYGGFLETFTESNDAAAILKGLAGPGIGTMANYYTAMRNILKMDNNSIPTLLNLIQHNSPFTSLFYVKPLLDKYIMTTINNAFDPGYTAKLRAKVVKNAQKYGDHLLWLPGS